MPSTMDRLRTLVEVLYIATSEGRLSWSKSTSRSSAYVSKVNNNLVEIDSEPGSRGDDIRINIYDSEGNQIDTFVDPYFGDLKPSNVNFNGYYSLMTSLLEGARRSATGADKIVDGIIAALGAPPVEDPPC